MATVSALYKSIVEMSIQAEISHDIDSLMHTVQDILNSPTLCHRALRAGTGVTPPDQFVGWAPGGGPGAIGSIQANDGNGVNPPVLIVTSGAPVNASSKVQVRSIVIRDPNPAALEGVPASTQFMASGVTYTAATAKVQIDFEWRLEYANIGLPPGLIKPRTADVTVAVLGGQVRFCYGGGTTQSINVACGAATSITDCSSATPAPTCNIHYFLAGFDALANPICDCRVTCIQQAKPGGGGKGGGLSVFSNALGVGAAGGFGAAPGGAAAAGPGAAGAAYGAGPAASGPIYTN